MIISKAEGQYQVLYALLAGTGLRIEEAFALQVEDIEEAHNKRKPTKRLCARDCPCS